MYSCVDANQFGRASRDHGGISKSPYQFSKIDGDIEKSSDFISEIVIARASDYSCARGREPTPPVPGIQYDHSLTEDV